MPKEEWGTKRVCPTTGKRFYDLNKSPIVSPYTGEVVTLDTGKGNRMMVADKADKASEVKEAVEEEDVVLEDDAADVDLGDDVLEDDDDDDEVSLDDIADVASDEDDS
ncbi:MAG: TIGR02300 family protein [Alphaproteobacteria bacterium]|nr:TIGR02300 family protein [Alphaproteobacteria bacterium]